MCTAKYKTGSVKMEEEYVQCTNTSAAPSSHVGQCLLERGPSCMTG